jgi:hypothetical protein
VASRCCEGARERAKVVEVEAVCYGEERRALYREGEGERRSAAGEVDGRLAFNGFGRGNREMGKGKGAGRLCGAIFF